MSLMSKFDQLAARSRALAEHGVNPFGVRQDAILSPTEAMVEGRHTILAGTNNYLGLTFDQSCIDAARDALEQQGTGTTGSRMANGTFAGHVSLEEELARFYQRRHATVFSTGFLANLGVLSSLTGRGDVIVIDSDSHASIYDGCDLSGAEVIRFRHNDPADLDKRLGRLGERCANTLVVCEGIYSMLGDRAPLADIVEVKKRHGAMLLVDEAHSLGVIGERGLTGELGLDADVEFITGTFSKSLGATGGFFVSDVPGAELLRYGSRAFVFTASLGPSVIASVRQALRCLQERPELREQLWNNARHMYGRLRGAGFKVGPEASPVIAVMLSDMEQALAFWKLLLESGVYVNLVFPPATPNGAYLLRCSMSAAHTPEQVDRICDAFEQVREQVSALSVA